MDDAIRVDMGLPGWLDYPMPPDSGSGGYEIMELAIGFTVVRSSFNFDPSVQGQWLPLLQVNAEFVEPSFQAMTTRGMRGSVKELYPEAHLAISQGIDLFRHTTQYSSAFNADASCSGEVHHASIARSMMNQLIGDEATDQLLTCLNLVEYPSVTAKAIPLHVSQPLTTSMPTALTGATRKLFSQAKILEYLSAMVQHLCENPIKEPQQNTKIRERSHALHAQLISSEGKLATLDELAEQYGRSAKLLNEEFNQEFGQTIYTFVTEHRLMQAHIVLLKTDISIKRLSAQLGYTHVSNFTNAFKRKFGYSPGSLRKV